jgi:hypothetical protein
MTDFDVVFQLDLPAGKDGQAFITFVQDELFPAVRHHATRVGVAEGLTLMAASPDADGAVRRFQLHMAFNGAPMNRIPFERDLTDRLQAFGVNLDGGVAYREVAVWPKHKET